MTSKRAQAVIIGLAAAGVALGGFETGRRSVDAEAIARKFSPEQNQPSSDLQPRSESIPPRELTQATIRDIATVPFSELYDVLKAASREQLLAWARDLEQMPRGPRQRAAVAAYYKSLIQVDHHAALEVLSQSTNLLMRDIGEDAMLRSAPESIWQDIAEALAQMRYPGRGWGREDVILNWSRVDPVAASKFLERHWAGADQRRPDGEDMRVVLLLRNWGEIDPGAARSWIEADASRQTKEAFRAFLTSWGHVDHGAAIDYAIANQRRPNFEPAINELVYDFVRSAKEDASRLILLLPPEQAKTALKNVAAITNPEVIDPNLDRPPDYQRPPDEVARWMVTLPLELWSESIGVIAQKWLSEDVLSATTWFSQLRPDVREAAIVNLCSVRQSGPREEVIKLGWTISDGGKRENALRAVAKSLRHDYEDAIEAVNGLEITDEQKAYFRKIIPEVANGR